MDFKDWRKSATKPYEQEREAPRPGRYRGKGFYDYIDEQIQEAQKRGDFDNLPGTGKPLALDENPYTGDKALGYTILQNNGLAPAEIELAREIREEFERLEEMRSKLSRKGQVLRARRIPPFANERRVYNDVVEKTVAEYERKLRELNRKILTLNLTAPSALHQSPFNVEKLLQRFRETCPLFT
jgi:DnaJ homolog subfamily C member 28